MIKNYLLSAIRALSRHKAHAAINIFGLSLAMACCVLIGLYVKEEVTYDQFHKKSNRIFRAYAIEDWGENQRFFNTTTPFPLGPALKDNYQEVEYMVRVNNIGPQVRVGNQLYSEVVTVVGQHFLNVFDFEMKAGDRGSALSELGNIILTEDIATKYFGDSNPIDRTIGIQLGDKFEDFVVKGVVKNPPSNSSIQFSMLISDLNYPRLYSERLLTSAWFNITPETYILLREGVSAQSLESKFPSVFESLLGEDYKRSKYFVGLQPITDIHFNTAFPAGMAPVTDPKYVYILTAIAVLVLSVACINFITLSVGRSLKRAKEVGIRKVAGAERSQLIFQFITEAVSITFLSVVIGLLAAVLLMPLFNELSGKQLVIQPDWFLAFVTMSFVLVVGIFAGSYPAFLLSGFKPITILKGTITTGSKQTLRKVLVGVQLVLSIFLISSTLIMKRQLNFLQNKDLGFDRDQTIVLQLVVENQGRMRERIAAGFEMAKQFKPEFQKIPGILSMCASAHDFGNGAWTNVGYTDEKGTYRTFNINVVDEDYFPALKMDFVAGRNFSEDMPADAKRSVIVNEAFVKEYGWKDPIGQRIPGKNFIEHEVIGVVKDFNYASLYAKLEPLLITMNPEIPLSGIENINIDNSPIPKLLVKLKAGEIPATIERIKATWDKLTNGKEFDFSFVDERLNAQYRNDQNLGRIVTYASLLAIIIGSLGLYSLAALAMHNRVKEISIRKVMGASENSLLVLLSREYFYLVCIALVCSVPATWYLMEKWLTSFEFRIPLQYDVFLISGAISLVIAMLTISYRTYKTALSQPAKTLKYE
jgi:putative ABC transport system permease protein